MRVVLVAPSRSDPAHARVLRSLGSSLRAAGDDVYLFPPSGRRSGLSAALERLLRQKEIDVCHVHCFSRRVGFPRRVRLPARTALIVTHQGASLDLLDDRDELLRLARRADAVTSVSRAGSKELKALRLRRAPLAIPNGAEPGPASRAPGRRAEDFILTVGRLAAYKGTDVLLMAFAALAESEPGLRLVVCGPDQSAGRLPRFAAALRLGRRARFPGAVGPRRVDSLLGSCRFFVLPSRDENMPMALLEAMARGKAVIAARVGGVAEAVTHGVDGLLVPPNDVKALTRAMRLLCRDARLRARLGRRARETARRFEWGSVARRYRRLYAEVAAARR